MIPRLCRQYHQMIADHNDREIYSEYVGKLQKDALSSGQDPFEFMKIRSKGRHNESVTTKTASPGRYAERTSAMSRMAPHYFHNSQKS